MCMYIYINICQTCSQGSNTWIDSYIDGWMYVYMRYIRICIYIYTYTYIDILHMHGMYMAYTHMYICIHTCVCVWIYVYIYICMYINVYIYIYIYININIYILILYFDTYIQPVAFVREISNLKSQSLVLFSGFLLPFHWKEAKQIDIGDWDLMTYKVQ